jgi:HEAT repeat protein
MTNILLAAVLTPSAAALPPAVLARPETAFPITEKLLGDSVDPLSTLVVGDEDLRDSLNSLPTADSLARGLRERSEKARLAAVQAAAFPRNVGAVPHLAGVMLRLDQPASLRAAAALALGRVGDRVAVPALSEALNDPAPEVRFAAALSLGRLPADGVATRLERMLRFDPVWQARYAAAIALGRTRKAFAADALAAALNDDHDWQVRQQAARSLQELGTVHAAEALQDALNDPDPSVRAAAGIGLAAIGGPAQRLAVAQAVDGEPDPTVRALLASASRRPRPLN